MNLWICRTLTDFAPILWSAYLGFGPVFFDLILQVLGKMIGEQPGIVEAGAATDMIQCKNLEGDDFE